MADTLHAFMYMNDIVATGAAMLHVLTGITTERDQAERPTSKNEHRIRVRI